MIARADEIPDEPDDEPENSGGLGGDALIDPRNTNSSLRLIRRAVREDWPITQAMRSMLVRQIARVVKNSPAARNKVAAARVLVAADAVNQRREASDQADEHKRLPNLNLHAHIEAPPTIFEIIDKREDDRN